MTIKFIIDQLSTNTWTVIISNLLNTLNK